MSFTEMESSAKTEKKVASHPKVSVMVDTAIKTLADRKGSSLQAIYKYINANYNVDVQKLSTFIKKYLKSAVECGDLVQPKGKGASGSFKINKQKAEAKPKAPKVKSPKPLKMRTSTPKKTMKPKKAVTKVPSNSPVKKIKQTDEEVLADSTFTITPNPKKAKKPKVSLPTKPRRSAVSLPPKVKKPKNLMSKKAKEPKVSVSPEGKSANKIKSPKPLKTKSAEKSPKDKKSSKAKKPASSIMKKAVPKKVFPKGG